MTDSLHDAAPYRYTFGEKIRVDGYAGEYTFGEYRESNCAFVMFPGDSMKDMIASLDFIEPVNTYPSRPTPVIPPPPGGYVDGNPKTRAGASKPTSHAIPPAALMALGMVMQLGEKKYGLFNWREFPVTASTYLNAAERHLLEFRDGETFDRESGVIQLAHVMACCAIVIDALANGTITDDRTKFPGAASDLIEAISKGQANAIFNPR